MDARSIRCNTFLRRSMKEDLEILGIEACPFLIIDFLLLLIDALGSLELSFSGTLNTKLFLYQFAAVSLHKNKVTRRNELFY